MAPIICSVIDTRGLGVQGVYVTLKCYDLDHSRMASLHSITDHNGEIGSWFFLFPSGDRGVTEPRVVDNTNVARASMAFFPHPLLIGSAPWTSIRTDVPLEALTNHVILHISDSPRLEFRPCLPIHSIGSLVALRDLQTPSPLELPSPLLVAYDEQGTESARVVGSEDTLLQLVRHGSAYENDSVQKSQRHAQ